MKLTLEVPDNLTEGEALQFIQEGIAKKKRKEKKQLESQGKELTAGQKAKATYDWFVDIFPKFNNGEKYHIVGGRDMRHLTDIFKNNPAITEQEIANRLFIFLGDKEPFLCKKGHAINLFNPNAYSESERANAGSGRGTRQGVTIQDIQRVTNELRGEGTTNQAGQRRHD